MIRIMNDTISNSIFAFIMLQLFCFLSLQLKDFFVAAIIEFWTLYQLVFTTNVLLLLGAHAMSNEY